VVGPRLLCDVVAGDVRPGIAQDRRREPLFPRWGAIDSEGIGWLGARVRVGESLPRKATSLLPTSSRERPRGGGGAV
jgi:hypothetical protein